MLDSRSKVFEALEGTMAIVSPPSSRRATPRPCGIQEHRVPAFVQLDRHLNIHSFQSLLTTDIFKAERGRARISKHRVLALLAYIACWHCLLACIAYRHSEKIGRPTFDTTTKQTLVSARRKNHIMPRHERELAKAGNIPLRNLVSPCYGSSSTSSSI